MDRNELGTLPSLLMADSLKFGKVV